MKKPLIKFINDEAQILLESILLVTKKQKSQEINNLFETYKTKLNLILTEKKFYVRFKTGLVADYSKLSEVATAINYAEKTIENSLGKGGGITNLGGNLISIAPLEQGEIIEVEEGFWFRDSSGQVIKFTEIDKLAKICGVKPKTIGQYLTTGKGKAQTKKGLISKTPLRAMSRTEAWEQDYFDKHGIYPNPSDVPDEPFRRNTI